MDTFDYPIVHTLCLMPFQNNDSSYGRGDYLLPLMLVRVHVYLHNGAYKNVLILYNVYYTGSE